MAISEEAGRTFAQARASCKAEGFTDLASIHSPDEMRMAAGVCSNWSTPCFIGLSISADSRWEWSDGTSTEWEEVDQLEGSGSWVGIGRQELDGSPAWHFQDKSAPAVAFICEDRARNGLQLVGDAIVALPPMTLGGPTVGVSSWMRLDSFDKAGRALLSSYQSAECGSSMQCKNAVGETLDSHGWLAIGTQSGTDLFVSGAVFDNALAQEFFSAAAHQWAHFTFSVVERAVNVFVDGNPVGVGTLEADLPRMLRSENSMGGSLGADPLRGDSRFAAADFRVYDRSLSRMEAAALHTNPSSECCISAGLISAFGIGSIDLSTAAMTATGQPSALMVLPEVATSNVTDVDASLQPPCSISEAVAAVREVDICGDVTTIEDCRGVISDGAGPYIRYRFLYSVFSLCNSIIVCISSVLDTNFKISSQACRSWYTGMVPHLCSNKHHCACQVRRLWPPAAWLPRRGVRVGL